MDYTGVDNLEIMKLAENYNAYLETLVLDCCRGMDRILDFGAGLGVFADRIRKKNRNVCCFEVDAGLANHLTSQGYTVWTNPCDVPPDSLDAIYALNVLEHIADDETVLSELYSWLRPGGTLLVYVPACMSLYSAMDRKVGHYRRYDRTELDRRAQRAGFTVKTCEYADSLGYVASLVYKFMGNDRGDLNPTGLVLFDRYVFPVSRIFDRVLKRVLGKNVLLIAEKPRTATA